jgi:hypothetical protein
MGIFDTTDMKLDALASDVQRMQAMFKVKFGVFAYPAFGTLLGIVRENDFIKGDTDLDMCWHSESAERLAVIRDVLTLYHKAKLAGVMGFVHNRVGTMKVQVTPAMRDGGLVFMDMCVSWKEGGKYWVNIFGSYGKDIDMTPVPARLRNETVFIPKGAEDFLAFTYGDWRTPRKREDGDFRAKNIVWGSYLIK